MYLPSNSNLEILAGRNFKSFSPFAPFEPILCEFLHDVSKELINIYDSNVR